MSSDSSPSELRQAHNHVPDRCMMDVGVPEKQDAGNALSGHIGKAADHCTLGSRPTDFLLTHLRGPKRKPQKYHTFCFVKSPSGWGD
ncbi:hypothetical protein JTE90_022728 [Oedothorax gibbosus]|uniref:Uncharacterized protein n=1 Tax=Oedothorax gibbosus TaxID=931172 RepID=A0AAV6URA3_9ARAC|nr:hypothetical protein JTE90_022728 [Oedothorax gibbosus]